MKREYSSAARTARREATREELSRQGLRLFAERGFETTQIADIAKASGVATGTFYVHFDDKDALARDALEGFNRRFLEKFRGALEAAGDASLPGLVEAATDAFLSHWWSERAIVRGLLLQLGRPGAAGDAARGMRDGFSPELVDTLVGLLESQVALVREQAIVCAHGLLGLWLRTGIRFAHESKDRRGLYGPLLARMTKGLLMVIQEGGRDGNGV